MRRSWCLKAGLSSRLLACAAAWGLLATCSADAGIVVNGNSNTADLVAALTGGGGSGVTVTAASLDFRSKMGAISVGTYTLSAQAPGTYDYDLVTPGMPPSPFDATPDGIAFSTGDVRNYGSGPNTDMMKSFRYNVGATVAQNALLEPISGPGLGHMDVTELLLTFDAPIHDSHICFDIVFGTEEWLKMFTFNNDAFGAFLNGVNVAIVDGHAIAANHPGATELHAPPQTTELNGVILSNGSAALHIKATVVPGSTGNTLRFILGDTADAQVDSTVYISNFKACPEPASWCLGATGLVGLGFFARRRASRSAR